MLKFTASIVDADCIKQGVWQKFTGRVMAKGLFTMGRVSVFAQSALLACCLISFNSGCNTMGTLKNSNIPIQQAASNAQTFTVEIHPTFGKPVLYTGQVTGNKSVQTALEESGAIEKIRKMHVNMYRKTGSYQPLKMPITFEPKTKTVKLGMDYAIHPGDRIVIESDESSPLDKLVGQFMGTN